MENVYEKWCSNVATVERVTIENMTDEEREDAFFCELAFGTAGLRGKLGLGPNRMNEYTVAQATQGLANYLNANFDAPSVAICRDTRHCGEAFVRTAAQVLAANGVHAHVFPRVEPTPCVSFAVRTLGTSAGINITASHNPAAYNGYKVYGADGCQITSDAARAIQAAINATDCFADVKTVDFDKAVEKGLIEWISDEVLDEYIAQTLKSSTGEDCSKLKIVYTPLHGVGLECVSRILEEIHVAEVVQVEEQCVQDGDFPTCPYPNPEIREALELGLQKCKEVQPDLLLATDPDADRVGIAVPHAGEFKLLSGNEVGCLLLDFLAQKGGGSVACTTIVSAPMASDIARERNIELRRTLTGFKYIGEQIALLEKEGRRANFLFGFEESYGYLAGTGVRDKDAVVASMLICELAAHWKAQGKDLFEAMQQMYATHGFWANTLLTHQFEGAEGVQKMKDIMQGLTACPPKTFGELPVKSVVDYSQGVEMPGVALSGEPQKLPPANVVEFQFDEGSRVIFRPSGTEPKMKAYIYARGNSAEEADTLASILASETAKLLEA